MNIFERIVKFVRASGKQKNPGADDQPDLSFNRLAAALEQKFDHHFLQVEFLLSLYNILPNLRYLPPTRGWAGSPDFLVKIAELIIKHKPRFVLEAGCGVSTLIIGLALKLNQSGTSVSLEHIESYLTETQANIEVNHISDVATLQHCPIINIPCSEQPVRWYDITNLVIKDKIDLLVVDGPPGALQPLARYPVVPLLHQFFSDNMLIVLDDTNRQDETVIIEEWIRFLEAQNFTLEVTNFKNYEKGMVVFKARK